MCFTSRTALTRRCAKLRTGRGFGSIRISWLPSSVSRRDPRSGTCCVLTTGKRPPCPRRRFRQAWRSTRTISTISRPPSPRWWIPRVPTPAATASASRFLLTWSPNSWGSAPRSDAGSNVQHCCTTSASSASATPSSIRRASWTITNGRDADACRAFGGNPVAYRCVQRTCPDRRRASRAAGRQGLSARPLGRPDLPGNPYHHYRRYLRCAHRRPPLSRGDADHESLKYHVRDGRHPDRRGLFYSPPSRARTHRRDAGGLRGRETLRLFG